MRYDGINLNFKHLLEESGSLFKMEIIRLLENCLLQLGSKAFLEIGELLIFF